MALFFPWTSFPRACTMALGFGDTLYCSRSARRRRLSSGRIATCTYRRCGSTTWHCTSPPRGPQAPASQRGFQFAGVVQTNNPIVDPRFSHGCETGTLQVSHLFRISWFLRGGGRCIYPPLIATSRFADFITLAYLGATQYFVSLLRV